MDAYASTLRSAIADVVQVLLNFAAGSLFTEKFKLVFGTESTPHELRFCVCYAQRILGASL